MVETPLSPPASLPSDSTLRFIDVTVTHFYSSLINPFWYNCSTSSSTTSRLVSWDVTTLLRVWTPDQICGEPNGLRLRGRAVQTEDALSRSFSPCGLTGAIVKNVNWRVVFSESPRRRQTVPAKSSCACELVWLKKKKKKKEKRLYYLHLCGMYGVRNCHSPAIFLYE